ARLRCRRWSGSRDFGDFLIELREPFLAPDPKPPLVGAAFAITVPARLGRLNAPQQLGGAQTGPIRQPPFEQVPTPSEGIGTGPIGAFRLRRQTKCWAGLRFPATAGFTAPALAVRRRAPFRLKLALVARSPIGPGREWPEGIRCLWMGPASDLGKRRLGMA